jgi:hypothetical protein
MTKLILALIIVVLLPGTAIILWIWVLRAKFWKKFYTLYVLFGFWALFIVVSAVLLWLEPYFRPMVLTQHDIYGEYVIDRSKFPGYQADWQYDNFRFKITSDNKMIFQSRTFGSYWKSDTLTVSYSSGYYDLDKEQYCNRKLRVHSDSNSHHIIREHPTLYRKSFNRFYYVFESEKFGNVFFKKGNWR